MVLNDKSALAMVCETMQMWAIKHCDTTRLAVLPVEFREKTRLPR